MIGGDEEAVARAAPLIDCYAKMQARLGDSGAGQLAKMVNQICIAGLVQGLAEALHFAGRAGLDAKAVVDVISKGAAQSWQMDNRASTMVNGEFEFEGKRLTFAGNRARGPVLFRSTGNGGKPVGHLEPDCPTRKTTGKTTGELNHGTCTSSG
jgi:hypothetical protein